MKAQSVQLFGPLLDTYSHPYLTSRVYRVTWKRLKTETPQHGNVSKKRTHKTNLMSSSLMKKNLQLFYY